MIQPEQTHDNMGSIFFNDKLQVTIGQRNGISSMDAKQMNLLYKCQGASGNGGNGGAGETGGGNSGEFYACFSVIEDKAKQKTNYFLKNNWAI